MTAVERFVAVIAGIVCMIVAGVVLVRQAALAADATVSWPASNWWADLTLEPSWGTTGVAAAIVTALAAALVILTVLQALDRRRGPEIVELKGDGGQVRLSVPGLERAIAGRVRKVLPGTWISRVELRKDAGGWRARVELWLPPTELATAHQRAIDALRTDLRRSGGLELARLDLVVVALRARK